VTTNPTRRREDENKAKDAPDTGAPCIEEMDKSSISRRGGKKSKHAKLENGLVC